MADDSSSDGLYPSPASVDSLCLGSGRFLRSVLVPALVDAGLRPAIVQTRGRTFLDHCLDATRGGEGGGGGANAAAAGSSVAGKKRDADGAEKKKKNGDDDGAYDDAAAAADALEYEVDTVEYDGTERTERIKCYGAGTLGSEGGKREVMKLLEGMNTLRFIGVGVTESGLLATSPPSKAMSDLTSILRRFHSLSASGRIACPNPRGRVCVLSTDNVPRSGRAIRERVLEVVGTETKETEGDGNSNGNGNGGDSFEQFLDKNVAFLDTMVDRITSQRPGSDGLVPRCEPVPSKALVIEDLGGDLPPGLRTEDARSKRGVVVRSESGRLDADVALKLRVANGTHTAAAQAMALCGMTGTESLAAPPSLSSFGADENDDGKDDDKYDDKGGAIVMEYLDSLFSDQILPGATSDSTVNCSEDDVRSTWDDWRRRLCHPTFGLSTFFIAQNCAAKGGIRLGPTVRSLLLLRREGGESGVVSAATAFAVAAVLRYLTPAAAAADDAGRSAEGKGRAVYRGWLDGSDRGEAAAIGSGADAASSENGKDAVAYADGLRYNLSEGWYEFRCDCSVVSPSGEGEESSSSILLPDWLARLSSPAASSRSHGDRAHSHGVDRGAPRVLQPNGYRDVVESYLTSPQGGNLSDVRNAGGFADLVDAVCTLYARMVAGDGVLRLLTEMRNEEGAYAPREGGAACADGGFGTDCAALADGGGAPLSVTAGAASSSGGGGWRRRRRSRERNDDGGRVPLHYRASPVPDGSALLSASIGEASDIDGIREVVRAEVASAEVVDLHTHLLPPSHGPLCLWGIDELLTYHYLVAEYFITAPPSVAPESFYALSKSRQAGLIWQALFVDRSPVSEACRGVITTLAALGLGDEVRRRDLGAVRRWYGMYRAGGKEGAERFSRRVFETAGVRYAIMTNVPFDANEAACWRPKPKEYPPQYRSALRVDPLLAGDRKAVETALAGSGYDTSLEGARKYLRDWIDTMKPEYMMASTPHDFVLPGEEKRGGKEKKTGVNEEAMKEPGAFARAVDPKGGGACGGGDGAAGGGGAEEDESPSVVDERSDLLSDVLMRVCEERDLPVALKIGAHRAVNPSLGQAGDGVATFADPGVLARLCARFPRVRFLATFLSRESQHEACVLASKFRNLHLYGCWWFCNNPSLIEEITKMRVEMLGTACTAQHSDARVLDQLVYKWPHSRAVIASVLAGEYAKLVESGWTPTRAEVRRDVRRLFGGSYEEFMEKSLK